MIVLALQYHAGDRERALRLARFIAEIEPERREDVGIFLNCGCDSEPMDFDTMCLLGQRFPLAVHKQEKYRWSGWPAGPNGMALDLLELWSQRPMSGCTGIYLLEPDCVPLSRDWLTKIGARWDAARAEGAWMLGSWRNSGGPYGHINGCAVVRPDFARLTHMHEVVTESGIAWDCAVAPAAKDHWVASGLFRNDFQSTGATEDVLRTSEMGTGESPVVVHGYKDDSAFEISKKLMNL